MFRKLESLGVRDPLLKWIKSYLSERMQRVVIDGQSCDWMQIDAGVPQVYADDTYYDRTLTANNLNKDLERINAWTRDWLVTINPDKTKSIIFSTKRIKPSHPNIYYNNQIIENVSNHKHLGVTLCPNLFWRSHIFYIYEKASKKLNLLKGLKFKLII